MIEKDDFLPNRLNFDAIIFSGCTFKEIQVIAIVSLLFCMFVLGCLTELLFGMILIGVGLAFPVSGGLSWMIALILQKAKQGKPKGYLKQKIYLFFEDRGLLKTPYVRYSGKWSIGRYLD